MADESGGWYVRSRGRTLGPFSWAQLESLRDRGHLARFHEVSQDRQTWTSAATLGALFGETRPGAPAAEDWGPKNDAPIALPAPVWFYNDAGMPIGPVSADQIAALVQGGRIKANTPIWKEGLAGWVLVRDVSEFANLVTAAGTPRDLSGRQEGSGTTTVPPAPSRTAGGSRSRRLHNVYALVGLICILAAIAILVIFLVDKYRTGELELFGFASVNSHTSINIPQAIGLVISGATVTNLRTGALVEIPGSRGTCFALSPKGHLLTNKHVVEEYVRLTRADAAIEEALKRNSWRIKPSLWVYFGRERYDANVIYMSARYDMALLKVERESPYFRPAYQRDIVQGTRIYALGFPARSSEPLSIEGAIQRATRRLSENVESVLDESDYRYSITDGIVSHVRREVAVEYIQHSAKISAGNSGGPLIDDGGRVLGINTLATFDQGKAAGTPNYYALNLSQALDELQRKVPGLFRK
jgi:hypothetical protein